VDPPRPTPDPPIGAKGLVKAPRAGGLGGGGGMPNVDLSKPYKILAYITWLIGTITLEQRQ
jgi:hypothetical protein